MANGTTIEEDILAKVVQVKKKGREGDYQAKVVQHGGKDYEVGKNYKDQVEVGSEYHFKLTKSEFKDKLYYWANLVDGQTKDKKSDSSGTGDGDLKSKVFSYLNGLDKDKKKAVITYLLERI